MPSKAWHGIAAMGSYDRKDMGNHGMYSACCRSVICRIQFIVRVHLGLTRVAVAHIRHACATQQAYDTSDMSSAVKTILLRDKRLSTTDIPATTNKPTGMRAASGTLQTNTT